jgi:hypothetical protein
MSSESTPILSGTIPAIEMFMLQWEKLRTCKPLLKPWIDEGLKWATKYYNRMDSSKAYAIPMCEYHYRFPWDQF